MNALSFKMIIWWLPHMISLNPLQTLCITGSTVTKAGEITNPFVETRLNSSKANNGNPTLIVNLKTTRIINALQNKKKKKGRDIGDSEKRSYNLWYDLIVQLADSDVDEEEESEVESDEEYSDESGEDEVGSEEENEEEFDEDDDDESEEGDGNEDWLHDLLVELYEAQEREKENGNSQS
ncbi:hypothetical protein PIB30_034293 [Stylosanthes scabra]|uniref:Uncharacterized protein n=1 Tax=Stylosanthes scabra TaxID=79078 RepID=A0ABU6ZCN4_9FABA|nr:hypothetical protein [Stylosanthes scabra]